MLFRSNNLIDQLYNILVPILSNLLRLPSHIQCTGVSIWKITKDALQGLQAGHIAHMRYLFFLYDNTLSGMARVQIPALWPNYNFEIQHNDFDLLLLPENGIRANILESSVPPLQATTHLHILLLHVSNDLLLDCDLFGHNQRTFAVQPAMPQLAIPSPALGRAHVLRHLPNNYRLHPDQG